MSARGGRRNGMYAPVPVPLSNSCPRCEAPRGRKCVKKVGEQWLPMVATHKERTAARRDRG